MKYTEEERREIMKDQKDLHTLLEKYGKEDIMQYLLTEGAGPIKGEVKGKYELMDELNQFAADFQASVDAAAEHIRNGGDDFDDMEHSEWQLSDLVVNMVLVFQSLVGYQYNHAEKTVYRNAKELSAALKKYTYMDPIADKDEE